MKTTLVAQIVARLNEEHSAAASLFFAANPAGVRYTYIDDLLPADIAARISEAFPDPSQMRLMSSFREKKFTSKNFDDFDPILKEITFAMQDPAVVEVISSITGIQRQIPDPSLYAGGLSAMGAGHFLNPHIDNSHEASRQFYRTLNLLYYVTPEWSLDNGGNLELWDRSVKENVTIHSKFNRLVLMETTPTSWHSVSPVVVPKVRCCVSNYYFSDISPTQADYFNVTSFSARPNQLVRRAVAWGDNWLRQGLRAIVRDGFGKADVYTGDKK